MYEFNCTGRGDDIRTLVSRGAKNPICIKRKEIPDTNYVVLGPHNVRTQEAKYIESWPNTTSACAGWSRFDILVDKYGGVHSLLLYTSSTLESPTCH